MKFSSQFSKIYQKSFTEFNKKLHKFGKIQKSWKITEILEDYRNFGKLQRS